MKLKKKKAFTLTELLVVVVVIGVLSAVTLPKFSKVMETRKTTEAEELMSAVRMEQEKRCSLDKPYLADINELKDILPTQTTKNFEYSLTGTGIKAASKGKYSYELEIPSYSDGRICCNNKSECDKLNKDYPLCEDLVAMADYQEASSDCSAGPVCSNEHYNGEVSTKECTCGTVTSTWRCNAETGYAWELPDYPACTPKPADNTQSCPSGYTGKKTQTHTCVDGVWTAGEWKNNCTKTSPSPSGSSSSGSPIGTYFYTTSISGGVYWPGDTAFCGSGCGLKMVGNKTQIIETCSNLDEAESVCARGGKGCYFANDYSQPKSSTCSATTGGKYTCEAPYYCNTRTWYLPGGAYNGQTIVKSYAAGGSGAYIFPSLIPSEYSMDCSSSGTIECEGSFKSIGNYGIRVNSGCSQVGMADSGAASTGDYECVAGSSSTQSCTSHQIGYVRGYVCSNFRSVLDATDTCKELWNSSGNSSSSSSSSGCGACGGADFGEKCGLYSSGASITSYVCGTWSEDDPL